MVQACGHVVRVRFGVVPAAQDVCRPAPWECSELWEGLLSGARPVHVWVQDLYVRGRNGTTTGRGERCEQGLHDVAVVRLRVFDVPIVNDGELGCGQI